MSLQDLVKVTITKQTSSVSRRGFGVPMLMSSEAFEDVRFATTTKIYTALDQLGSSGDGFDADGVTFLKAQSIFAQNPKPAQLVIGKRSNLPTMKQDMIPIVPAVAAITTYSVTIGGRGATAETFNFVTDATPTVAEIIAGMVALINAGTQDVLAVDVGTGTSMTVESADGAGGSTAPGKPFTIAFDRQQWTTQNITADPGVVADLDAIRGNTDGNDDWYQVYLDSYGLAEITVLSASIETIRRTFLASTSDADALTSATTDIGSVLQALSTARTGIFWHENPHLGPESAWGGKVLPSDPGSVTWKFKTLALIAASNITPTEEINLRNKNINRYLQLLGVSITCDGKVAGGEFLDIVRGIDFITARLEENIFGQMAKLPKISFTDPGIGTIENEVRGVMQLGITQGIFAANPAPVVTVPLAADVDSVDKANRLLPDVTFTATLAGAIHAVEVDGIVTL